MQTSQSRWHEFRGQWLPEYQFGGEQFSRRLDYPCKLMEDRLPRWVEVKDAIHDGNVNFRIPDGQPFRVGFPDFRVADAGFGDRLAGVPEPQPKSRTVAPEESSANSDTLETPANESQATLGKLASRSAG